MKLLNFAVLGLVGSSLLLSSCFKRDNTDWTFERDNAIASELFQDVYKQMDESGQTEGGLKSCPSFTLVDTIGTYPNSFSIDFGTGCLGIIDARTRSGLINGTISAPWRDAGAVATLTTSNYKVNNYELRGTVTITNNGINANGNLSYTVTVTNGEVIDAEGKTIQWNGTTTYEMVSGANTTFTSNGLPGVTDDVYHITGSANGVNRNGTPFTADITNRLVRDMSCRWIKEGTIQLTPQNGDPRTLDFGDGTCDGKVTFSFKQWNIDFTLP